MRRDIPYRSAPGRSVAAGVAKRTRRFERPIWVPKNQFLREVMAHQADPGLAEDLRLINDKTTDDLPLR